MSALFVLAVLLAAPAGAAPNRPRDFDQFWNGTKEHLAARALAAELKPDPEHSDAAVTCFKASYSSLRGATVHARYCRPAADGIYPAVLINPEYGQGAIAPPIEAAKAGFAALAYQARGFDVDLPVYPLESTWYVLTGFDEPETYVFRDVVANALRGVDFLVSRPEADAKRIGVMGADQGGGVSLLVAGLDKRVAAAAADFPFLADWPDSLSARKPPYSDVREYVAAHKDAADKLMKTLRFFDAANVADRIEVPVLVQVGLKDQTCPPAGVKSVYGLMKGSNKTLKEYPKADHADQSDERRQASIDFLAKTLAGR
jgi:cephalosporin-C deacetylase